jgi:anti-sigma factor RsiW
MSDFKDIWNADEGAMKLTDEQLLAYLEGRMSEDERLRVEGLLSSESMESDALEGLQELDADEVKRIKRQLDTDLSKTLGKKRRNRRGLASQQWNTIAIIALLLLIIICFAVFWMMKQRQ